MENYKRWSVFDITWFTSQLLILLLINIILIATYDSKWIAIVSLMASMMGAVGTWLAVKKYNINYLFGIVHVILYGLIAFVTKVYGDFALNIFIFLPMDIMGWIIWMKLNSKPDCPCPDIESCTCVEQKTVSKKLGNKGWIVSIVLVMAISTLMSIALYYLGDPAPILDSLSTTISIFGMWLMMSYYREQWWVWLIVNLVSVSLWIQVLMTGEMISIIFIAMWTIYTVNSIIGIMRWNENETNTNE